MVVRVIEQRQVTPPRRRRPRIWLAGIVAFVALVVAAVAVVVALWSGAKLSTDSTALARVELQPLAGTLVRAAAFGPDGQSIPLRRAGGRLTPLVRLEPGELISVDVVIRRPGWLSWALGSYRDERLTVRAPVARITDPWVTVAAGGSVRVDFAQPVSALAYATPGQPSVALSLSGPTRAVTLPGLGGSGTAEVSAAVRPWETLSSPIRVSWFPPASSPALIASPAPGSSLSPAASITLTFSKPVATVLGSSLPTVSPAAAGSWRQTDSHTLVYTPAGVGEPLGSSLAVTLPRSVAVTGPSGSLTAPSRELYWTVPLGSTLRLQQLLAQEGYLPVGWTARRRRSAADDRRAGAGRDLTARRRVQLALSEHSGATRGAVEAGPRERDHARRGDALRADPRPRRRRPRRADGLARAARRRGRRAPLRRPLQLRLRPQPGPAEADAVERRRTPSSPRRATPASRRDRPRPAPTRCSSTSRLGR